MTSLRRFSTSYLQSDRRKVLIPYCEHDSSDAVLNQFVNDKTLLPTDSICLVNVVTPGLLSQLTAYSIVHGAAPVSTTMELTCASQPNPRMEFMVSRAEDMLEKVAQRLRNTGLNVRTVVLEGEPRCAIMNIAQEFRPDIIICTAGKTGRFKKLFKSSISQYLMKNVKKSNVIIISPDNQAEVVSTHHSSAVEQDSVPADLSTRKHKMEMV